MNDLELLDCPYCDMPPDFISNAFGDATGFAVACSRCGVITNYFWKAEDVAAVWNRYVEAVQSGDEDAVAVLNRYVNTGWSDHDD